MEFYKIKSTQILREMVVSLYKKDLLLLFKYTTEILEDMSYKGVPAILQSKSTINKAKHSDFVQLFIPLFRNDDFIIKLYEKLASTIASSKLYSLLIWEEAEYSTEDAIDEFDLELETYQYRSYGSENIQLDNELAFITRELYYHYAEDVDKLYINHDLRELLKLAYPYPDEYFIKKVDKPSIATKLTYNNENEVFQFIDTIDQMLQNNLVEFGKTNEKPLLKSLNILRTTSSVNEFYTDKKLLNTATDMLTRSFSYYYFAKKRFRSLPLETLKDFVELQLNDQLKFFISRIFSSHLKKIRFDEYYSSQGELFEITKTILKDMPLDGWVDFSNILKYCKYRGLRFDFESKYKTSQYNMECDLIRADGQISHEIFYGKYQYEIIVFEPIIKAMFFYLASLGILEIKYNEPTTPYAIKSKNKPYLTIWDQIQYVKYTKLGLYIFGYEKTYEVAEKEKVKLEIKFDEYKPIITIGKTDTITLAKLDPYVELYDTNRYILKYSKIFKDCNTYDQLIKKIDIFYKIIGIEPPKVFVEFFEDIKRKANILKNDLEYTVIEVKNNKDLLELFMRNKKLQEIIIKAQGYKVIILKSDLAKFTKIVKDNGFFIEF